MMFEDITNFLRVYRHTSFSRAAFESHTLQSAIIRLIPLSCRIKLLRRLLRDNFAGISPSRAVPRRP
jgi:hypothetical protein